MELVQKTSLQKWRPDNVKYRENVFLKCNKDEFEAVIEFLFMVKFSDTARLKIRQKCFTVNTA